jgi:succinyl-diaminopimelate desuccinylase
MKSSARAKGYEACFLSAHGIKGIVWGAEGDMSQHSGDEHHVNFGSVYNLYDLLDVFMNRSTEINVKNE